MAAPPPYVPFNVNVYAAAFAGASSGMGISGRNITDNNPADYAGLMTVAGAFSAAVDTAWNATSRTPNQLDLDTLESGCEGAWSGRSVTPNSTTTLLTNWTVLAEAIVAVTVAGDLYFSAQGITPPIGNGGAGFVPITTTEYYVDPQNISGHASDSNSGTTALTPFLTVAKLNSVLLFGKITLSSLELIYLSDRKSGDVPLDLSTLNMNGKWCHVIGTAQFVSLAASVGSGTLAMNPATGQKSVVVTTGASEITDFAPYVYGGEGSTVPCPVYLADVNTGANGWIAPGSTGPTAWTASPVTTTTNQAVFTIGDTVRIYRNPLVEIAPMNVLEIGASIVFLDCSFDTSPLPQSVEPSNLSVILFQNCSFNSPAQGGGAFVNCYFANGTQLTAPSTISAGVLVVSGIGTDCYATAPITIGDDCFLTGVSFVIGDSYFAAVTIENLLGFEVEGGIQVWNMTGTTNQGAITALKSCVLGVQPSTEPDSAALLWGTGSSGAGIVVGQGVTVSVSSSRVPTLTGATDFEFYGLAGSGFETTARAWNNTAGAWTAPITCSWANFIDTLLYNAQAVNTNAALTGVAFGGS